MRKILLGKTFTDNRHGHQSSARKYQIEIQPYENDDMGDDCKISMNKGSDSSSSTRSISSATIRRISVKPWQPD